MNRTAHTAFVRVANGDDGALLATSGGAFVIDLRELLVQVADRIGLPGTFVERIPADAGRLTVFESDQVDALQQAVRVVNLLSVLLFVLVVVLYGTAVFFAADRRAALRNVGVAILVGSVLLLVAQQLTINISVEQLARAESGRAAIGALVTIATSLLNQLVWSWLAMGVVIVAFAVLIGPSRAAVVTRGLLAPVMSHPVGAWALALGALGLYVVLAPGVSIDRWITALIVAALFVTAVELLRRQPAPGHSRVVELDAHLDADLAQALLHDLGGALVGQVVDAVGEEGGALAVLHTDAVRAGDPARLVQCTAGGGGVVGRDHRV